MKSSIYFASSYLRVVQILNKKVDPNYITRDHEKVFCRALKGFKEASYHMKDMKATKVFCELCSYVFNRSMPVFKRYCLKYLLRAEILFDTVCMFTMDNINIYATGCSSKYHEIEVRLFARGKIDLYEHLLLENTLVLIEFKNE